jgi:hypothetical protein
MNTPSLEIGVFKRTASWRDLAKLQARAVSGMSGMAGSCFGRFRGGFQGSNSALHESLPTERHLETNLEIEQGPERYCESWSGDEISSAAAAKGCVWLRAKGKSGSLFFQALDPAILFRSRGEFQWDDLR